MDEIDFGAILADLDRREAEVLAADQQLEQVRFAARSGDGLVDVVVNAMGVLTELRLMPEVFRRSNPQYLGQAITETARFATQHAHQAARAVAAPIVAVTATVLSDPELRTPARTGTPHPPPGADATSTDRTVRAFVDAMGILAAVHIAPEAFRNNTTERLAASIVEAAELAARTNYESRWSAVESVAPAISEVDLGSQFPVPPTPDPFPADPEPEPEPQAPEYQAPPEPAAPQRNPRARQRDVGPSDWDDDFEDYGDRNRGW